nr:ABC transporter permease subunit [Entomobacter blattae]
MSRTKLSWLDLVSILCIIAFAILVGSAARHTLAPLSAADATTIHLDPSWLPSYALRTVLRMFAALFFSLLFTFTYAVWAAKNPRVGMILVPVLDILQSVPILGFLTFTVVFFMGLFPGQVLGAELAAIFTIFTSQAWNMAFSMYQSLKTVPSDLEEVAKTFQLTPWQKFWKLEAPFATPSLVWNTMMSMSGGWFMIVYSETISVGQTSFALPGIGSYVGAAIDQRNIMAVIYAIIAMFIVIISYDQLLFRPLVTWSSRFRMETVQENPQKDPWVSLILRRTPFLHWLFGKIGDGLSFLGSLPLGKKASPSLLDDKRKNTKYDILWYGLLLVFSLLALEEVVRFCYYNISIFEVFLAIKLGFYTLLRVIAMIALASLIWVPAGVYIGLNPAWAQKAQVIAQIFSAFPANLFFPIFVLFIVHFHLNSNIWLTPLMILGTQWYILFNVVGGAASFPTDLKEVTKSFHIQGWLWWRQVILPAIFPSYITGALTASGGAWNAAIAAEVASWGSITLSASGLGAYIAHATTAGDTTKVGLGMVVMSSYVLIFNRAVWRPLYNYASRRLSIS